MYLVMADSREKIIGVSDTETDARGAPSFLICKFYTIFVLKSCAIRHLAIILKLWYYQYRKKEGY